MEYSNDTNITKSAMRLPPLISQNKTPKIFWYQNDAFVIIRIMLCDVENYFLKITHNHFKFRTNLNSETYSLCFQLFGAVHCNGIRHVNLSREIKIFLPKTLKFWEWQRLTYDTEKNNLIVKDLDHIYTRDWSDPKIHLPRRKINPGETIHHFDPSQSDREDSDDERWELAYDYH